MPLLQFARSACSDYAALLRGLPAEAVATPTRSSVPLVDYWRDPEKRLREIGEAIGIILANATALAFEHATRVPTGYGRGKAADLMITTPDAAVAIEAKFKEPPYEDVRTWLRTPFEENRKQILGGWIELIRRATASPLELEDLLDLPYQLIHRTASVCHVARPKRAVVYQLFGAESPDYYVSAVRAFRKALGRTPDLTVAVLATTASVAPREEPSLSNADEIRNALCKGALFHLSPAVVYRTE